MGVHNSTDRGEITPGKPIYFRPFIEVTYFPICSDRLVSRPPFVVNTSDQTLKPQKFLFCRGLVFFCRPIFFLFGEDEGEEIGGFFTPWLVVVRCKKRIRNMTLMGWLLLWKVDVFGCDFLGYNHQDSFTKTFTCHLDWGTGLHEIIL